MASIYEIDRQLEELIDPETGELLDYDAFLELQMAKEKKIESTVLWVKNLNSLADDITAEIKTLTERKKAAQSKAEKLSGFLYRVLDGGKFTTASCEVKFIKSQPVEVDEELLPKKYFAKKTTISYKPDKVQLGKLLKGGKKIKGCRLVDKYNIQIK